MASGDFKLSAALRGHEEDVRAVVFPTPDTLFSASRDNTVRHWTRTGTAPPTYDDTIALQGSNWFNGLAFAPSSADYPKGAFAAGGRETFVFVKQVGAAPDADPDRLLIGHAGNITCLAFSEDGGKVISGGWDSQVFVWDVAAGHVSAELTGHGGPIWGLLVYDTKFVLTACADKQIRIFTIEGKALHVISGHTDVVRCFAKLPEGHASGAAFASAGNDEIIRLWTFEGTPMGELEGHTAYIYALAVLPNGDIVSSSEDRSVKVWRDGACIQTITHPALSIWTVAACPETGDIVSGASDNIIRIFSRDPKRQADAQTLQDFDERNRMYAIPAETAGQGQPFQKENLPGPEALHTQTGARDGQQLFIREHDGSVTAHLWSASTSSWNLIGTVVEGEGSGSSKKVHEGKEYDYVFDIDIEDGKPPLKLPYNLSESAWEAARKFLERNELPMSYYEQVANWITENTKGARLGQSAAPPAQAAADPWGTDRRYRPGDADSSGSGQFPIKKYLEIIEGNPANAIKIIGQKNAELKSAGQITPEQTLTEDELAALEALSSQLQNKNDPNPTTVQTQALLKVVTTWPSKARVPAVGVLALLAVSPAFVTATTNTSTTPVTTIVTTLHSAGLLAPGQESANNVVHALRLLVNLFRTPAGLSIVAGISGLLPLVKPFATQPESPAQARALATLYHNFAVSLAASDSRAKLTPARELLIDIATLLEGAAAGSVDSEGIVRLVAALGTLLAGCGGKFRDEFKGGVAGTLHLVAAAPAAQTEEVRRVIGEVRGLAR